MREYYQPRGGKKGRFALRENTYRRTWYLIADYPYFKAIQRGQADALAFSRTNLAEQNTEFANSRQETDLEFANSTHVSETMLKYNVEKQQCDRYIAAVESALKEVPKAYAEYIMSHIIERKKYKDMEGVSETTLKIWTQRFIWHVAHNLGDA